MYMQSRKQSGLERGVVVWTEGGAIHYFRVLVSEEGLRGRGDSEKRQKRAGQTGCLPACLPACRNTAHVASGCGSGKRGGILGRVLMVRRPRLGSCDGS
jgi:hypothetical protein